MLFFGIVVAQNKTEKIPQATQEVTEGEKRVAETKADFEKFSRDFKLELERFDFIKVFIFLFY